MNHHSSSDISPVSNESTSSSPVKEGHSPEGSTATYHLLGPQEEGEGVVDVKGQVRMEVQGEEEKREDEEDEEDEDVSHVDEEDCLGVQREDRRGGDGQINALSAPRPSCTPLFPTQTIRSPSPYPFFRYLPTAG